MTAVSIGPDDKVVFIGDSITDAGRDRNRPDDLGDGYVARIAEAITSRWPTSATRVLNRGVGGNRAIDVKKRWDVDCRDLHPDVVSLLVGVNDTWRRFDEGVVTTAEEFTDIVGTLLAGLSADGVDQVVLIEPFALPVGVVTPEWEADLRPRIEAVRTLALEHGFLLLRASDRFEEWARQHHPSELLADGVHPTPLGHRLLAGAWLETAMPGVLDQ